MDRLLKVTEAAEILGLSPSTVRKMFWEGRLTRVKVGRSTRIRQGDLEAIIRLGLQPTRQGKQRRYKSQEEVVGQKPSKSPDPHVRDFSAGGTRNTKGESASHMFLAAAKKENLSRACYAGTTCRG